MNVWLSEDKIKKLKNFRFQEKSWRGGKDNKKLTTWRRRDFFDVQTQLQTSWVVLLYLKCIEVIKKYYRNWVNVEKFRNMDLFKTVMNFYNVGCLSADDSRLNRHSMNTYRKVLRAADFELSQTNSVSLIDFSFFSILLMDQLCSRKLFTFRFSILEKVLQTFNFQNVFESF